MRWPGGLELKCQTSVLGVRGSILGPGTDLSDYQTLPSPLTRHLGIEVDDLNMVTLKKAFKFVNAFNTIKWLAIVVGVGVIGVALYLMKQNKNRGSYDNRVLPTLSTKTRGEINMAFEGSGKNTANNSGVTTVQEVLRNEKGDIDASTLDRNSAKNVPGLIPGASRFFCEAVGLEQGKLNLVKKTNEELLD
uniref:(California timema) hypothetical protein n=1 Tax=Timema californicum TaxID=61474 RepID=A0A7R9PAK4_TIMCA|nr:unnamed protein product [Timema californicum]